MDTRYLEEAYRAGFVDAVKYATGTSSYTRALRADVRDAYQLGFSTGATIVEEQRRVARVMFRPQLRLVR